MAHYEKIVKKDGEVEESTNAGCSTLETFLIVLGLCITFFTIFVFFGCVFAGCIILFAYFKPEAVVAIIPILRMFKNLIKEIYNYLIGLL